MYMRNFGEFFNNQVEYAGAIIMSRTDIVDEAKAQASLELLREINSKAAIITTPIEKLEGKKLLEVMEHPVSLADELMEEEEVCPECGHVHEHGEHHHDHDHDCCCGHDHDHHHHHHADDVFTSWGKETVHKYTEEELDYLLKALSETTSYGTILRSKGIIQMTDGGWKQFDLVPEEYEVREGQPDYTGRICVIGTDLKEEELLKLFHV